ncbi:hypothetical protein VL20_1030 [Microcystis panniformis FACHB-1757]|uniref:Uncharacterized protein n=1 Tax=Microcystis panniformis FACHB-1757 TaxID=1638788 RepID=A0A0K1RWD6_9CHRO|nr:hypothetical protein VL20_1030 [Microcystis panniformis FACHB-1757]
MPPLLRGDQGGTKGGSAPPLLRGDQGGLKAKSVFNLIITSYLV